MHEWEVPKIQTNQGQRDAMITIVDSKASNCCANGCKCRFYEQLLIAVWVGCVMIHSNGKY